jgi:ribosomal-protein-alanine N-acetyltransferase
MHKALSIRRFRASDLDAILKIEHASFYKDAYDRNLFAEFHHKCGDLFLVAEGTRGIGGYMVTCTRSRGGSRRAELVSLAVDPKARHQGVASALMDSTLRRLRRRRVTRFSLMVKVTNRAAMAFYRKYRFLQLRIARGYYEDGKDAWLMVRDLA